MGLHPIGLLVQLGVMIHSVHLSVSWQTIDTSQLTLVVSIPMTDTYTVLAQPFMTGTVRYKVQCELSVGISAMPGATARFTRNLLGVW